MSQPVEFKKKVLHSAIAFALAAGISGPQVFAFAEEEEPDTNDEVVEEVEEEEETRVTVTGSRISRPEFSSISPVQVIDGEIARDLGLFDAADLLAQTSVVNGQQFTTGLSTSAGLLSDSGPGSATASLRGLDPGRTLVMINGRRLAPAGVRGAPSAPDLNLIPGSLIERVDVLLDGASSVYGSDAVAGVVNYVLRTDFDGLQLDYFTTDPRSVEKDGQTVVSATWGFNSDTGFIGFGAEYSRAPGYQEKAFANFYEPYRGDCLSFYTRGFSGELYESCGVSFGAGSASTAYGFLGYDGETNLGAGLPPGFFQIPISGDLLTPGSANGAALLLWPEEFEAAFAPDFERKSFYTYGEYAPGWAGDATTYFEASWANRLTKTNTRGQGRVRIPGDYARGNFGGFDGTLYYGNTFINDTEVSQTRFVGGIKGDIPGLEDVGTLSNWAYDGYVSYSRSQGSDLVNGVPYFPRLQQTLANTRFDAATGQYVCDSNTVSGEGQTVDCRPLNFFDPLFIQTGRFTNPADNDYLFPNRITYTVVEQTLVNAFVGGEIFDMPSGMPASLVVGFEYREDRIQTATDAGASNGDFFGFFGDPGSNGERWLRESFMELDLPVLADMPLVSDLSFNLAARWTEEENFGRESTYRFQGQYAPVDWLRIRGSVGTSFRAPNLGEQFGGQVTGFGNPNDPCRTPGTAVPFGDYDNDPTTPDTREYVASLDTRDPTVIANCLNGGGPFGLAATDPFSLGIRGLGTQNPVFFGAPTQVASGSNPNLQAETSKAKTYGIVFKQPWSDAFELDFSASYFDIIIDNEVDQLTAATIVARCYNSAGLVDPTCQYIQRAPRVAGDDTSGEIQFVEALQLNLGEQRVEGIDYNIEFGTDFAAFGMEDRVTYNLIVRATRMLTDEEEEFRATETFLDNDLREFGNPVWRANITNIFGLGDWQFIWQARYISDMIEDNDDPYDVTNSGFNPCVQANDRGPGYDASQSGDDNPEIQALGCVSFDELDEYWVHDLTAAWRGDDLLIRFGLSNAFNDAPPLTNNNTLGNLGGLGYDIGGRTLFANVTVVF